MCIRDGGWAPRCSIALFTAAAQLLIGCNPPKLLPHQERGAVRPGHAARPAKEGPDLGIALTEPEARRIDITILPDGTGLPAGSGNAGQGAELFASHCEACHGKEGRGGVGDIPRLTGGVGSLASRSPVRTVNSFWPYAPLIFDYVWRTMPPTAPQSLSADDTYSVVAYILSIDNIVPETTTVDRALLPKVSMPNRNGFISFWPPRGEASIPPRRPG